MIEPFTSHNYVSNYCQPSSIASKQSYRILKYILCFEMSYIDFPLHEFVKGHLEFIKRIQEWSPMLNYEERKQIDTSTSMLVMDVHKIAIREMNMEGRRSNKIILRFPNAVKIKESGQRYCQPSYAENPLHEVVQEGQSQRQCGTGGVHV